MKIVNRAILALLICIGALVGVAHAALEESGTGARGVAMGQAQTAAVNDASAITYNPGALAYAVDYWDLKGGSLLQVGIHGYQSYLRLNGIDQQYPYTWYTTLGALIPLGKRIVIGVDMQVCNDWFLFTKLLGGPRYNRYAPTQQIGGGYGVGLKITDKLSIGYVGLTNMNFNFSTISLDLNALLAGLGLSFGDPIANMNPYMEVDVLPSSSYKVGALYRPFKWLNLGVSYAYKNPAHTIIPIYLPPGLLPETTVKLVLNSERPTTLSMGVAVFPNEHLTLAFDMTYAMWSRTKNYMFIYSSDPGLFASDNLINPAKDTWTPKVGLEYKDNMRGKFSRADYAVRIGYLYSESPYNPANSQFADIDNDAHNFSGGLSLGYHPQKRLDYIGIEYFWEYIMMVPRSHVDINRNPAVIESDGYIIFSGFTLNVKI